MAGQGEKHVIQGWAAKRDIVDRDLRIVQLTHDMRKPPRPSSCRNRDLSHVLVNRMVAIHSVGKDPDGSSDVVACVHDHLDALAADLRL